MMFLTFSSQSDDDKVVGRGEDVGGLQLRERDDRRHHPQRDCGRPVHGNVGQSSFSSSLIILKQGSQYLEGGGPL